MYNILKAEKLKLKHTFGGKLHIISPCIVLLLTFILMGGITNLFSVSAWNWWYSLFLSSTLAIICYLNIKKDKKLKYYNIKLLNESSKKMWIGKIIYCAITLFISNIIICIVISINNFIFETDISILRSFLGAIVLIITYLWQIPLFLYLSNKVEIFGTIFISVLFSMSGVIIANTNIWWIYPPSIPVRLMCPILKILPNGLVLPLESNLNNNNVILPGIILSIILFIILTILTANWFDKLEV